jgi:uncharacterized protein YbaR (Trm112 family)
MTTIIKNINDLNKHCNFMPPGLAFVIERTPENSDVFKSIKCEKHDNFVIILSNAFLSMRNENKEINDVQKQYIKKVFEMKNCTECAKEGKCYIGCSKCGYKMCSSCANRFILVDKLVCPQCKSEFKINPSICNMMCKECKMLSDNIYTCDDCNDSVCDKCYQRQNNCKSCNKLLSLFVCSFLHK